MCVSLCQWTHSGDSSEPCAHLSEIKPPKSCHFHTNQKKNGILSYTLSACCWFKYLKEKRKTMFFFSFFYCLCNALFHAMHSTAPTCSVHRDCMYTFCSFHCCYCCCCFRCPIFLFNFHFLCLFIGATHIKSMIKKTHARKWMYSHDNILRRSYVETAPQPTN